MIIHFKHGCHLLCNQKRLHGGRLYSKYNNDLKYAWRDKEKYEFLFTTSDAHINCPGCIAKRIDFYKATLKKLEDRLEAGAMAFLDRRDTDVKG